MKSGGDVTKAVCQGLTGEEELFCELTYQEQCVNQVATLCDEVYSAVCEDLTGKAKKQCENEDQIAWADCASDIHSPWTTPADTNLAAALQNKTKWFSVGIPELMVTTYSRFSLLDCGKFIADLIRWKGVPESFDPFLAAHPFTTVTMQNVEQFASLEGNTILVVGKANDPATLELQRQFYEEQGEDARLLFVERPGKLTNQFKKIMKKLGLFSLEKKGKKKKWQYGAFDPDNPQPQAFLFDAQGQGDGSWSVYYSVQEIEEYEEASANLSILEQAQAKKQAYLKKQEILIEAQKKKQAYLMAQALAKKKAYLEAQAAQPGMVITEEEVVETTPTPAAATIESPVGLKVPDAYSSKIDAIVEAEKKLEADPMAGYPRILTPSNFTKFFLQKGRPVIVVVADHSLHEEAEIQKIVEEQQALPEAQQAFIAVLDIGNAQTRNTLWVKLTGLKQEPHGMINKEHIKSFAAFTYKKGKLGPYTGLVDLEHHPQAASISPLQKDFYFKFIKKDKIEYPMTVYAVHDPTDYNFSSINFSVNEGSTFYVDWSDPESRSFASNYLGIPPLTDNYVYQAWTFKEADLDEHAYFTNLSLEGGGLREISDLVDATSLVEDPLQFRYVSEANFEQYFSLENRQDSIVVVGDPLDDDTQQLLEQISGEKNDLGHDLRLIMIPHTKEDKNTDILKKLGISTKVTKNAQVYTVNWNEQGKKTTKSYTTHGFETVHASNDVFQESVVGTNKNVLLVIGDTNESWDAGVAKATQELKGLLVEEMADGSMTVQGKKIAKLVFMSHVNMQMVYGSSLENPQQGTIEYNYVYNPNLPQMYVISGPANNRTSIVVSGADLGMPLGGWAPDERSEEPVIENIVKKQKQKSAEQMAKLTESLGKQGIGDVDLGKIDTKCTLIGDPFQEITPMSSAWQVVNKEFIVVIGREGDSQVNKLKKKLVKLKESCQEERKFLFVDTSLPPQGTDEYSAKVAWLSKLFTKVFNLELSGESAVLECKAKITGKGFNCKKYSFPK